MFAVIVVAFIIACFFAWFFTQKSKEDERRLLIEKGYSPSELPDRKSWSFSFPWLKIGVLIISISVGFLAGSILQEAGYSRPYSLFALIFFGGLGMIIAHFINNSNDNS